jgi:hypothetical protein
MSSEGKVMVMGRWSLFSFKCVDQVQANAKWAEATETSGEEGEPWLGRWVGVSWFKMIRGLASMDSAILSPQESDREESQPA